MEEFRREGRAPLGNSPWRLNIWNKDKVCHQFHVCKSNPRILHQGGYLHSPWHVIQSSQSRAEQGPPTRTSSPSIMVASSCGGGPVLCCVVCDPGTLPHLHVIPNDVPVPPLEENTERPLPLLLVLLELLLIIIIRHLHPSSTQLSPRTDWKQELRCWRTADDQPPNRSCSPRLVFLCGICLQSKRARTLSTLFG